MALVAFVVVTLALGLLLTAVAGQASAVLWLVAATAGVFAAAYVRRLTGAGGGGFGRLRRPRGDDGPADGYRCPACDGTGEDRQSPRGRDAPPPSACRVCGGKGWVDRL